MEVNKLVDRRLSTSSTMTRRMNSETIEGVATGQFGRADDDANVKPIPFKICVVGNSDVGKTCIVERYVNNIF